MTWSQQDISKMNMNNLIKDPIHLALAKHIIDNYNTKAGMKKLDLNKVVKDINNESKHR